LPLDLGELAKQIPQLVAIKLGDLGNPWIFRIRSSEAPRNVENPGWPSQRPSMCSSGEITISWASSSPHLAGNPGSPEVIADLDRPKLASAVLANLVGITDGEIVFHRSLRQGRSLLISN
jgi:hypothetical protein